MNNFERELFLSHRQGFLKYHNLWSFWDSLTDLEKDNILTYFENTPQFFYDYKTLFIGDLGGSSKNGPIGSLGLFFFSPELETYDKIYKKFIEYTPENYCLSSKWGAEWESKKTRYINILKNTEYTNIYDERNDLILKESLIFIEDIYWCDAYFFVQQYSEKVYKFYLKGECTIKRFENAFEYCCNNIFSIKTALTKLSNFDKNRAIKSGIIEQYLFYLEKQKDYQKCLSIIEEMSPIGWANDFEKRKQRVIKKMNK
jgi:hypothetical protein